jgi:hypothetical protein
MPIICCVAFVMNVILCMRKRPHSGSKMREIGLRTIRQLDWRDFETLVDLIFARAAVHLLTIATFGSAAVSCFPATILEQLRRHRTLTALSCVNRTTNNFCNSSTFSKPAL